MSKNLVILFFILSGCDWIGNGFRSESTDTALVRKAIQRYNNHDETAYAECFSENVNYFSSNGLGTTRFATGNAELKSFHEKLFKMHNPKIEILNIFDISPWVFVHQLTKSDKNNTEANVGYKIENGKITDVMVTGEKKIK